MTAMLYMLSLNSHVKYLSDNVSKLQANRFKSVIPFWNSTFHCEPKNYIWIIWLEVSFKFTVWCNGTRTWSGGTWPHWPHWQYLFSVWIETTVGSPRPPSWTLTYRLSCFIIILLHLPGNIWLDGCYNIGRGEHLWLNKLHPLHTKDGSEALGVYDYNILSAVSSLSLSWRWWW